MKHEQVVQQLPALRRYARALTGDRWAADDLLQDTLERACGKWRLWIAGTDLRAWLFTLMHNLYLNECRTAQVRSAVVAIDDVANELVAPGRPLDEAMDLDRCLQRLPAEQRAVLLLVTLEDLDYQEVARVLKIPVGTVMSRLARARARLRELMQAGAGAPAPAEPALRRLK
ncbi:sigma-70 family RNA polymerase sigma factor [Comamonas badia]|uniref:sigma-70 family RNA polymerase sigma factor n=1 Tax=Comamonas badia TaxID=265291 RepID=UPI000418D98A|nr:sigma-70 family RNA polymerase sigma factor [Comamonas badia]